MLLQCPDLSTLSTLRRLLRTSSTVRQAVQRARGHCIIRSSRVRPMRRLEGWVAFAAWLPNHAGLVSALELFTTRPHQQRAIEQALLLSLQCCSAMSKAAPAPQPAPTRAQRIGVATRASRQAAARLLRNSSPALPAAPAPGGSGDLWPPVGEGWGLLDGARLPLLLTTLAGPRPNVQTLS